jgi:protein-S-isoprenylcysteine O-methyltransferase Ste14
LRRAQRRHDLEKALNLARRSHRQNPDTIAATADRDETADPIRLEKSLRAALMPVSAYLRAALLLVCAAAALFGSAGSLAIVGFWIYLAILTVVFVAAFVMLDRGLLQERMRPGGRPAPLGLRLLNVILLLHWVIAGLDRGRLHWTATVPAWLQAFGLLLVAVGYVLVFWAMLVNWFFSSVVRIQSDRGQRVVTSGPYAFVRHPGYSAGFLIIGASGIALGSWLAAVFLAAVVLPFLVYRVLKEDRVLQSQLDGYAEYTDRVPWRLVPGIW